MRLDVPLAGPVAAVAIAIGGMALRLSGNAVSRGLGTALLILAALALAAMPIYLSRREGGKGLAGSAHAASALSLLAFFVGAILTFGSWAAKAVEEKTAPAAPLLPSFGTTSNVVNYYCSAPATACPTAAAAPLCPTPTPCTAATPDPAATPHPVHTPYPVPTGEAAGS